MVELAVTPSELKFRVELRKTIPVTLSLSNPGQERVAFKVKTTSPKKYCVRPSSGILEPGASKDIQVIMQALRELPPSLEDVKDKFLVQYTAAQEAREVGSSTFDPAVNKDIKQIKLRVLLVGPPKPPSPVPEGVEDEGTPTRTRAVNESSMAPVQRSGTDPAIRNLELQLAKAQKETSEMKRQLDLAEIQKSSGSNNRGAAQQTMVGYSAWLVVAIAVLAFLIGKYLGTGAIVASDAVIANKTIV